MRPRVRSGRTDGGSPKVTLHAEMEATLDEMNSDRSTPAETGSEREIVLTPPSSGLHGVEVDGGGVGTGFTRRS